MGSISKSFPLLLIVLLAVSSLIMATPAFAQTPTPSTTPTPSVPQFTIQLVGPPITVNTTYSLDSNTGQIVANLGYTNQYSYVTLTIKNQPFDSSYGSLYYNVQLKNKNTLENWTVVYYMNNVPNPEQTTDSDYTNISIYVELHWGVPFNLAGTQTDIQVQAQLGNWNYENGLFTGGYVFSGVTSPWSPTQTVIVPANIPLSPTPAPSSSTSTLTPTPTPTLTSVGSASTSSLLSTTTIALVIIAVLLAIIVFLLIYMRKRKPINSSQQTVSNSVM